jgi:hypothetical protein
MDLWIEFYFALSEKWAVGVMGCRSNGLSELWAVGIMLRILIFGFSLSKLNVCNLDCFWGVNDFKQFLKGQSRDNYIILSFNSKYKRWWINVIVFFRVHTILMQCLKIYVYSAQNWGKARLISYMPENLSSYHTCQRTSPHIIHAREPHLISYT